MYKFFSFPNTKMYNSRARKEILSVEASEYSDFGKPYSPIDNDPVDCCLPGSFMDCPKVADLGLCPSFMAQRCAKNWDKKCNMYADSLDTVKQRDFIRSTAGKKYCQLSPDSSCSKMCQPFDPIAQDSPQVCQYVGNEVLKNSNDSVDIGWYYPVNISPDYMGTCQQTCNVVNPSDIIPSDPVINNCLKYGYCNDILTNICQLAGDNNIKITHPELISFCNVVTPPRAVTIKEIIKDIVSPLSPPVSPPVKEGLNYKSSHNETDSRKKTSNHLWIFLLFVLAVMAIYLMCRIERKNK